MRALTLWWPVVRIGDESAAAERKPVGPDRCFSGGGCCHCCRRRRDVSMDADADADLLSLFRCEADRDSVA